MKKGRLGIGHKPKGGNASKLNLSHVEGINHRKSPRGETGTMTQRPTLKKGSISSDRGTFKTES